ncbi:transposase [Candidatus Bipolaricaulota bacterium]|nr:transposase [Candidatus Bipolaricaulota bacterium]
MPRIARGIADYAAYHVINRGNAKQVVFTRANDYDSFLELLCQAKERHPLDLFAYCVMPNHFHLIVRPVHGPDLSRFMQWLLTSHVRRHHRRYETTGHVWQGRFKSFLIQEDSHLLVAMRYVERNPVRGGLVSSAADWRWSSHRESIGQEKKQLVDASPISLPSDWSQYVNQPLTDAELEDVRRSVNRQAPYGSSEWRVQICNRYGLQSTVRRGRPKKRR